MAANWGARERLVPLGAEDNFWTTGGPGPCGRDSEVFIDRGESVGCGRPTCRPGCECERFLEIWNLVFIEFEQTAGRQYARSARSKRRYRHGAGADRYDPAACSVRL